DAAVAAGFCPQWYADVLQCGDVAVHRAFGDVECLGEFGDGRGLAALQGEQERHEAFGSHWLHCAPVVAGAQGLPVAGGVGGFAGLFDFGDVAPRVGPAAVDVIDVVDLGQVAAGQGLRGEAVFVGVGSESGDGAAGEGGSFGDAEVRHGGERVAPVVFGDAVVVEHGFGAEPAGCDGDGGAAVRGQLVGLADGKLVYGGFGDVEPE